MPASVRTAKPVPRMRYASQMKGAFTAISSRESGQSVSAVIINATPVAPPSMKSFGNRKLSRPKAALNTPSPISSVSFAPFHALSFRSRKPLASL